MKMVFSDQVNIWILKFKKNENKQIKQNLGKAAKSEQGGGTQININFGSNLHRMGEAGKVMMNSSIFTSHHFYNIHNIIIAFQTH